MRSAVTSAKGTNEKEDKHKEEDKHKKKVR